MRYIIIQISFGPLPQNSITIILALGPCGEAGYEGPQKGRLYAAYLPAPGLLPVVELEAMSSGRPPYDPAPYIALLEQALASPQGIEVDAGSQLANHRQRFYNSRRGRADLEKVKVRTSINNPTTHLWLIPESVEETYNAQEKSNVAAPGTDNGDPE